MFLVTQQQLAHITDHMRLLLRVKCSTACPYGDVLVTAAKLRDEFTIFVQGVFSLLPFEFPGSRFKRAKEAQRYINGVVSGEQAS